MLKHPAVDGNLKERVISWRASEQKPVWRAAGAWPLQRGSWLWQAAGTSCLPCQLWLPGLAVLEQWPSVTADACPCLKLPFPASGQGFAQPASFSLSGWDILGLLRDLFAVAGKGDTTQHCLAPVPTWALCFASELQVKPCLCSETSSSR